MKNDKSITKLRSAQLRDGKLEWYNLIHIIYIRLGIFFQSFVVLFGFKTFFLIPPIADERCINPSLVDLNIQSSLVLRSPFHKWI